MQFQKFWKFWLVILNIIKAVFYVILLGVYFLNLHNVKFKKKKKKNEVHVLKWPDHFGKWVFWKLWKDAKYKFW